MQDGTAWSDGQPLTTDDVIYSYELAKTNADLRYSTLYDYITSITATGDRALEVKLNPERLNPGMVKNFLTDIRIIPQHIWAEREGGDTPLSQFVDMEPVASGPYKLFQYSPERIALVRDDNYWGKDVYGLPAPKYYVHPIFKSNDEGNLALQNGDIDWSQQFVPQIWQMWEGGAQVGTWLKDEPYYIPGSIPIMIINVHKPGLDNPLVRQAIAYAIPYEDIVGTAMYNRGIGMFGGPETVTTTAWPQPSPYVYDLDRARALLAEAGYPNGRNEKTGEPLVVYLDTTGGGMGEKSRLDWLTRQSNKIKVQLVVRATDFNRFQEKIRKGNVQIYFLGWNADYPDPENFFFLLDGNEGKVAKGGENASNYVNPEFDRLFLRMKNMENTPERLSIIRQTVSYTHLTLPTIYSV